MTTINQTEVTIDTTTTELALGQILVSADRRGTKEKPLSDSERIRRVILPANAWGELTASADGTPMQGLTDVLRNALRDIASARLKDTLAESPLQRTVALKDYTIGALLAWNEETASSRGSITFTREQVEQWFPTSALHAAMKEKGAQWVDFISKRLATLAAKNHGLKKPEDADKLVVLLAEDANSGIGSELIQRLSHISKSLQQRTTDALSLDDL
jgi:hypothetical protein